MDLNAAKRTLAALALLGESVLLFLVGLVMLPFVRSIPDLGAGMLDYRDRIIAKLDALDSKRSNNRGTNR